MYLRLPGSQLHTSCTYVYTTCLGGAPLWLYPMVIIIYRCNTEIFATGRCTNFQTRKSMFKGTGNTLVHHTQWQTSMYLHSQQILHSLIHSWYWVLLCYWPHTGLLSRVQNDIHYTTVSSVFVTQLVQPYSQLQWIRMLIHLQEGLPISPVF